MATKFFDNAKKNKADEFYTQFTDIEKEIQAYLEFNPKIFKDKTILCPCDNPYKSNFFKYFILNFNNLGLKKLITSCYVDNFITRVAHKIEITEVDDSSVDSTVKLLNIEQLLANKNNSFSNFNGNGDFRSDEVKLLRDEADFIITNPPFSLFREFMAWITETQKRFLVIGNINAITYKEIFPLIKNNHIWLGLAFGRNFQGFIVPNDYPLNGSEAKIDEHGNRIVSTNNTIWLTNIEHGRRHKPLQLMTMEENLKFSNHKKIRDKESYAKYDNFNAIEVPFTDAIPSDYDGVMGVPISFLHKYCPEQFEIVKFRKGDDNKDLSIMGKCPYFRILIKNKGSEQN